MQDDWWNDHERLACIEYNHEHPDFATQYVYKQNDEWPNQCVDKNDKRWFGWNI